MSTGGNTNSSVTADILDDENFEDVTITNPVMSNTHHHTTTNNNNTSDIVGGGATNPSTSHGRESWKRAIRKPFTPTGPLAVHGAAHGAAPGSFVHGDTIAVCGSVPEARKEPMEAMEPASSITRNASINRSSSVSSRNSTKSQTSQDGGASYIVCVNKTPLNLTPSQRLNLRKRQLNDSISKFKDLAPAPADDAAAGVAGVVAVASSDPLASGADWYDNTEEEIDDNICMFNVPLSQSLSSMAHREKFVYTNSDRKHSMTTINTDSTRSSSIMSHASFDSGSVTSLEEEAQTHAASTTTSAFNIHDFELSKDAERLTLLFNKDEYVHLNETSSQRKQLLSSFKKVDGIEDGVQLFEAEEAEAGEAQPVHTPRPSHTRNIINTARTQAQPPQIRSLSSGVVKPLETLDSRYESPTTTNQLLLTTTQTPPKVSLQMMAPGKMTSMYFSFTRPTWLPPKASAEIRKHQQESEYLINQALYKETKVTNNKIAKLEDLKKQRVRDLWVWQDQIIPDGFDVLEKDYALKIQEPKVKDMYWRGIPSKQLRSTIWHKQCDNKLQITQHTCTYYFEKANTLRAKITKLYDQKSTNAATSTDTSPKTNNIVELRKYHRNISDDLLDTFPDLNYFQNYDTMNKVGDIITAFLIFMNETNQGKEVDSENINFNYYFTGLNNLTGILFYHFNRDTFRTFITLCNIFQKQLLNLLLVSNAHKNQMTTKSMHISKQTDDGSLISQDQIDLVVLSLNKNFFDPFEIKFKTLFPSLYIHFESLDLKPIDYLPNMLLSMFSNFLDFSTSCHIFDIYSFENDDFLLDCALGVILNISYKLFGDKEESLRLFSEHYRQQLNQSQKALLPGLATKPESYKYMNIGLEHEFMERVRTYGQI